MVLGTRCEQSLISLENCSIFYILTEKCKHLLIVKLFIINKCSHYILVFHNDPGQCDSSNTPINISESHKLLHKHDFECYFKAL